MALPQMLDWGVLKLSLNFGSNINQVAGWLTNVQRKQLLFATAGALTSTAFDVRKHVIEKTFPRDFDLKNKTVRGGNAAGREVK